MGLGGYLFIRSRRTTGLGYSTASTSGLVRFIGAQVVVWTALMLQGILNEVRRRFLTSSGRADVSDLFLLRRCMIDLHWLIVPAQSEIKLGLTSLL